MAHKKKMNAAAIAAYKAENENFLANLRGRTGSGGRQLSGRYLR